MYARAAGRTSIPGLGAGFAVLPHRVLRLPIGLNLWTDGHESDAPWLTLGLAHGALPIHVIEVRCTPRVLL
eukprot:2552966-Lingulodinium_polyedra.AAC.1